MFNKRGRKPWATVNFITAHDGFTLRDSSATTTSTTRPTARTTATAATTTTAGTTASKARPTTPTINELRRRGRCATCWRRCCCRQGTPMLLAGDEFGRTQGGNNNAYCQDNEISWVDWDIPDWGLTQSRAGPAADPAAPALPDPAPRPLLHRRTRSTSSAASRTSPGSTPPATRCRTSDWGDAGMKCFGMLIDGRAQADRHPPARQRHDHADRGQRAPRPGRRSPCRNAPTARAGSWCSTPTCRSGEDAQQLPHRRGVRRHRAVAAVVRVAVGAVGPWLDRSRALSITVVHGGADLPSVTVDAYNAELRDDEGFIGDRASKRAFRVAAGRRARALAAARPRSARRPQLGRSCRRAEIDRLLKDGAPELAGVIHTAVEDFAQEFADRDAAASCGCEAGRTRSGSWSAAACAAAGSASWRWGGRACCCTARARHRAVPDPQRPGRGRAARRRAPGAELDLPGARQHPGDGHRRHQCARRAGAAEPEAGAGPVPRPKVVDMRALAARRRQADARRGGGAAGGDAARADQARRQGGAWPGAVHRRRLPRLDRRRRRRSSAAARTCPATGSSATSTCRAGCARRSRASATTRPRWRCTTTRWCRG